MTVIPSLPKSFHRIGFLVYQDAQALDITGPMDVFQAANDRLREKQNSAAKRNFYKIDLIAKCAGEIVTSSGISLLAPIGFEKARTRYDTLMIAGGPGMFEASTDQETIKWIKMIHKNTKRTVSICSGAFLLAEAGILNDRRAATHWLACDLLASRFSDIRVSRDEIYVQDGKVFSTAGVTAGIDLALALVEQDLGRKIALEVARLLVVYLKRPGSQSQFSWPLMAQTMMGGSMGDVMRWILNNLGKKIKVEDLAQVAGMSPRSFARRFRSEVGETPAKFIEKARVESVRLLLEEKKDISLGHIARVVGFTSVEHLQRTFIRHMGVDPRNYEAHF